MVISLPNMMTGYVQITNVSATYTKLLERLGDSNLESEDDMQVCIQGFQVSHASRPKTGSLWDRGKPGDLQTADLGRGKSCGW